MAVVNEHAVIPSGSLISSPQTAGFAPTTHRGLRAIDSVPATYIGFKNRTGQTLV